MTANNVLLVLDNLESLLTRNDGWRDPRWGELMAALLDHQGESRVVLTSRRLPRSLADHPRLQREAIHALSFAESVLLARELPHLRGLFQDEAGLDLLRRTLWLAQGHPKLLELADGLAADREALTAQLEAAAAAAATDSETLSLFFAARPDDAREGETAQAEADFTQTLRDWTQGIGRRLPAAADLLFTFLCRLEPPDRTSKILEVMWPHFLKRLGDDHPHATAILAFPDHGLPPALAALEEHGLIAVERPDAPSSFSLLPSSFLIHPGVAEAARAAAPANLLAAADEELGNYWYASALHGLKTEMAGGSRLVAESGRRAAPYLRRRARWEDAATLLEDMIHRDSSPATLAFAIPLLRRIASETEGSELGIGAVGVLAQALLGAGRSAEAERLLRETIQTCVAQENFRLASSIAGDLLNLLQANGRFGEALTLADEMADYSRRAGLGPWTQLLDEGMRLQIMAAMGEYEAVLRRVEELRPRLEELPEKSDQPETANPWNVRETLLDTSCSAALHTEQWEMALALNADRIQYKEARGADALEMARTRFNDYSPLLRLKRFDAARALLQKCRTLYEQERAIPQLGKVYSALADLEDEAGNRETAVAFQETALRYKYQAGDPNDCAISHHNLANYLERQGADPARVLSHRLADAIICLQIQSGGLAQTLRNMSNADLPPTPPPFAAVADQVEQIPGVQFRALCARLPQTLPDGDAAITAVWQLVQELTQQKHTELLEKWEPRLQQFATAANDNAQQEELLPVLDDLQEKGWLLRDPVQRIWAGERDAAVLTAGLDAQDSALIHRLLEILAQP